MKILHSFNESIDIEFEPIEHTYNYKGRRFLSASSFVEDYIKPFNAVEMAYHVSEKTGVPQGDIVDMWESNGNVAAGFGTAMHNVIEYYFKYEKIGAKTKESNGAMPNHPFLKQVINDLQKIKPAGETYQEVLISHKKKNICGQVDDLLVLDAEKKICWINDYKFTANILAEKDKLSAPFNFMPPTKLSKNFIQLSFYAYMMMSSGWKVEGVSIYHWDGEWHKYDLEGAELGVLIMLITGKYV